MEDCNKKAADIILDRHKIHGDFQYNATYAQDLKDAIRPQYIFNGKLKAWHKEALDMILHKIARIVAGDPDFDDHWADIAGYAERTRIVIKQVKDI